MVEKLNLPFPMLSDPDRSQAIDPYGLVNNQDPRNLAIPATVVIGPDGDEVLRLVSRDYGDRPFEDDALQTISGLGLGPVIQAPPDPGIPEPGPRAMPFGDLRAYFRGAKFGSRVIGLRAGEMDEADAFGVLMDHYLEDVASMFRIMRDRG